MNYGYKPLPFKWDAPQFQPTTVQYNVPQLVNPRRVPQQTAQPNGPGLGQVLGTVGNVGGKVGGSYVAGQLFGSGGSTLPSAITTSTGEVIQTSLPEFTFDLAPLGGEVGGTGASSASAVGAETGGSAVGEGIGGLLGPAAAITAGLVSANNIRNDIEREGWTQENQAKAATAMTPATVLNQIAGEPVDSRYSSAAGAATGTFQSLGGPMNPLAYPAAALAAAGTYMFGGSGVGPRTQQQKNVEDSVMPLIFGKDNILEVDGVKLDFTSNYLDDSDERTGAVVAAFDPIAEVLAADLERKGFAQSKGATGLREDISAFLSNAVMTAAGKEGDPSKYTKAVLDKITEATGVTVDTVIDNIAAQVAAGDVDDDRAMAYAVNLGSQGDIDGMDLYNQIQDRAEEYRTTQATPSNVIPDQGQQAAPSMGSLQDQANALIGFATSPGNYQQAVDYMAQAYPAFYGYLNSVNR